MNNKNYPLVIVGRSRGAATHIKSTDGRTLCDVVWTDVLGNPPSGPIRNVAGRTTIDEGLGSPTCKMCESWALEHGERAGVIAED